MKFNIKLHEVCASDDLRPQMECIYFDRDFIVATNAHILAAIHVDDLDITKKEKEIIIGYEGKFIHKKAFSKIWNKNIELTENGFNCPSEFMFIPFTENNFKYPEWKRVIPNLSNCQKKDVFNINASLLLKLSQVIPSEYGTKNQIAMFMNKNNGGILVKSSIVTVKSYGVIMPTVNNYENIPTLDKETMIFEFKNTEQK